MPSKKDFLIHGADKKNVYNIWKTVYSVDGIKSVWILFLTTGPLLLFWGASMFYSAGTPAFGWLLFGIFAVAFAIVAVRYSSQRVETHPDGILIVNTWNQEFIPWESVDNIGVAYKNIVVMARNGDMSPPPEKWGKLVAKDETLILFDLANGPQRIVEIFLILKDERTVVMDAIHRDIVSLLSEGKKYYDEKLNS